MKISGSTSHVFTLLKMIGEIKMYTVNNKFETDEECFTVYRKPIDFTCPFVTAMESLLITDMSCFAKPVMAQVSFTIPNRQFWMFVR